MRPGRERTQSMGLVGVLCPLLAALLLGRGIAGSWPSLAALGVSAGFALLVWRLRAATPGGAAGGALVCLAAMAGGALPRAAVGSGTPLHTGLVPLAVLFALTFGASRLGRLRPHTAPAREAEERRRGRDAGQVLANLGCAAVTAFVSPPAMLAALAEATADTLASELGQAFGGTPWLGLRRVPAGTDGAVSLLGTLAGLTGAATVVLAGAWALGLGEREGAAAFAGGVAGLAADSLLGATLERRGWLGNDLVNFLSTVVAAGVALALVRL